MIKIIMVVPFGGMEVLARETFQEILETRRQAEDLPEEYEFEVLRAATSDEVLKQHLDADVIIVRGATAYDLQRSNYPIPVVELSISGSDLVSALLQMRDTYGTAPAGIIGSPNMLLGIEELARNLQLDVRPYILAQNTEEEIYRQVDQAISQGCRVILGGQRGCDYAWQQGVACMQLQSGKHSIANAIQMAMQIGIISRQNRQVALSNQALLDNAYEGLISLDEQQRIRAYNQSAQQILGMPVGAWCLGLDIEDALHSPQIAAFASGKEHTAEEIIEYHNTQISFRRVSVLLRGEVVGNVMTFLNAAQIQESEEKLRGKLYAKSSKAKYSFSSIIGSSDVLQNTIKTAVAYAQTDSNIMIYGESGTGKELFSQSIHNASPRRDHPFIAVNCSAIPETLLESELFGYMPGAFTGASKNGKAGLFEQAHEGTIFLDEISEMPFSQQSRLLRVLQEQEITRLGASKVTPINVRVIAATNRDLKKLVQDGSFREDLYYRLCVLTLRLPPLRERKEDIGLLVHYFLEQFSEGKIPSVTEEALDKITEHSWKGNIRELRNFCERLAVLSRGQIDLPLAEAQLIDEPQSIQVPSCLSSPDDELAVILEALQEAGGNKTAAAEALGISRVTLWRKLRQLGLH
ncbi:(S)-limonene 6-monooxygenase [uncultured Oscillibacter sp.]|uniref:sigma 54-interacting transcriptional regulator n=1 Tax=Oscillibacter sp. TaxID=1945593 RepID=UPI00046F69B5|nr:sigma 54-interacting transcriptional regulator [Oscillibacter sp.]SCI25794.1 (S)-limonene 6-monooxygenase [uncultured Oscillibacter sp.]